MLTIKKVAATPLPQNEAKVIDSFSTTDDKHLNAPSIDIVEQGLNNKANSSHTHTKSEITDFEHNHDDRYYTEAESDSLFKLINSFKVLAGTLNSGETTTRNYPTDWTSLNCVVISVMFKIPGSNTYKLNQNDLNVILGESNIQITNNDTTYQQAGFEVVIMRKS